MTPFYVVPIVVIVMALVIVALWKSQKSARPAVPQAPLIHFVNGELITLYYFIASIDERLREGGPVDRAHGIYTEGAFLEIARELAHPRAADDAFELLVQSAAAIAGNKRRPQWFRDLARNALVSALAQGVSESRATRLRSALTILAEPDPLVIGGTVSPATA